MIASIRWGGFSLNKEIANDDALCSACSLVVNITIKGQDTFMMKKRHRENILPFLVLKSCRQCIHSAWQKVLRC